MEGYPFFNCGLILRRINPICYFLVSLDGLEMTISSGGSSLSSKAILELAALRIPKWEMIRKESENISLDAIFHNWKASMRHGPTKRRLS